MDNAATSWPKPPEVLEAMVAYQKEIGASAGRGEYPRALGAGEILAKCREQLARLLGVSDPARIIFTLNCTDGLNLVLKGFLWKAGDHCLITMTEHNSVLRPLSSLRKRFGVEVSKVPVSREGFVDPAELERQIRPSTRLVCCTAASNVTGAIQPIAEIGEICRRNGIPFLVDAAQAAGCVPIAAEEMKIDFLAFPGHKSLLGPLGTGGVYIGSDVLSSVREGGTGSASEQEEQPEFLPDKYEAGSHNAIGLAGLSAALEWLSRKTVEAIRRREQELSAQFLEGAKKIAGMRLYGPSDPARRVPVFSVNLAGCTPGELSAALWEKFRIMTRHGLHCSPVTHQAIGTFPSGTCRFSFGPFTTARDVDSALAALRTLARR